MRAARSGVARALLATPEDRLLRTRALAGTPKPAGGTQRPGACWGFVAQIDRSSAGEANATIPMHVIADLQAYGPKNVPKTTRRWLRLRLVERAHPGRAPSPTSASCMIRASPSCVNGVSARTCPYPTGRPTWRRPSGQLESGAWLALAALDGDELLGYTWVWAVDHAAYLHEYAVRTAAMSAGLRLSAVLNYEAVAVLKRTASITEVTAGQLQGEEPGAMAYKLEQGYPVEIPGQAAHAWPVAQILRTTRPYAYQRLTGTSDHGAASSS